jgi:hypothetical protein
MKPKPKGGAAVASSAVLGGHVPESLETKMQLARRRLNAWRVLKKTLAVANLNQKDADDINLILGV